MMSISVQNIEKIRKILAAFQPHARLVAVSKTQPIEAIKDAYYYGLRVFGENKVQEMLGKYEELPKDIEWHLIGHLQTNKIKYIVPFVSLIHSVDSLKLLQEINKAGAKINRVVDCLLQIHIAQEETKFGFSENEIMDVIRGAELDKLSFVRLRGLMGMASNTEDETLIRAEFRGLKNLFERIKHEKPALGTAWSEISMGMSGDYEIALEEGSTMIRVGSLIFGERNYSI